MLSRFHGSLRRLSRVAHGVTLFRLTAILMAAGMIAGLVFAVIPARPAFAASITVDRTDDTAAASACTAAANDCSLRGAVIFANANPGTAIIVPAGTYNLTIDGTGESYPANPNVGDLDVEGDNTTITGAGSGSTIINQTTPNDRVIEINPALDANFNFTMSGVTIQGGRETTGVGGGGMISGGQGNTVTLSDVVFNDNQASGSGSPVGGGLAHSGGSLSCTNCTFTQNTSVGSGGGLYLSANYTGCVNPCAGVFSITGSTFSGNTSTNGNGGGMIVTSGSAYTISGGTFTGNAAQGVNGTGGAVFDESGSLTVSQGVFLNNQATNASGGRGGAIGSADGAGHNVDVSFSRFLGNSVATAANGMTLYGGSGSSMTAGNNWWGTNTGSGANDVVGAVTSSPWIILANTANPNPIQVNQSTTLSPDFLHSSSAPPPAAASYTSGQISVLIGLPVTWGNAIDGTITSPQAVIQSNGSATATFTANAAGAGSAVATVDNGPSKASITINKADTTTSVLSEAPDPSVTGEPVTVNYSVSSSTGSSPTAPTGNVTVSDGTDSCTGTLAVGSCSITFSSVGNQSLTAIYSGDTNFNASSSTPATSHVVNPADTTTTISSDNPDPSVVGQSVTVQYSVNAISPGSGTPTGNVTVSDGTVSCTGSVSAGQCSLTFTSTGAKSLTAVYAGDANYNGSTSAIQAHTVNQANTTTTITSDNPDPSGLGEAVTVNFTVAANAPGSGTPTGNVTVSDGVNSCTGTVASGTCTISLTTSGARTLTAVYAGDSNFNGSTSAGEHHTVNGIATTTAILSDTPDPSVVGQAVPVQYSVTPSGSGTPTGNVTVSDGTISCTATVAAGQCLLTFTSAGARSLVATYAGDGTFNGSISAAEPHQVNPANTTTTITSDIPDPSAGGQAVTIKYQVSVNAPGAGTPTGNVTVSDGSVSCTVAVAAGQCSITLTTNGLHTLTATYSGDSNFNASTSASVSHTVDAIPPSVTINQAATQADPTGNSPVHFTAVFSEPVVGFNNSGVSLNGTALATTVVVTQIAPNDGTTYDVAVSGMSANGTVIVSIPASVATDLVGNPNTASTSTDNTVTFNFDIIPPNTTINSGPSNPTNSTSATFTFSGTDNLTPPNLLTFQCQLDGAGFSACTSPISFNGLSFSSHTFMVRAIDASNNVDPTPATFTWLIAPATTSLLYTGAQVVYLGNSFQPAAILSSPSAVCVSSQQISFTLDRNPFSGGTGSYGLGNATTNSSGQATMSAVSTAGWLEGIYDLHAIFAGIPACNPSSNEASLTVASPGDSANGGGWYTLSGSGRVNFGFTIRKTNNTCTANCTYKGQLLLINNGKWRLKGTLNTFVQLATGQGASSGVGDLYWWNTSLRGGLGDWALAQSDVGFTINFYDSGISGKSSTDAFGINIQYKPLPPQPATLPNSTPIQLKGGNITVR